MRYTAGQGPSKVALSLPMHGQFWSCLAGPDLVCLGLPRPWAGSSGVSKFNFSLSGSAVQCSVGLFVCLFVCNRGDTIQYHGGLRSRELCQARMLLVFLTPKQTLSSHPSQCFCTSLKLLFFMIFAGVHELSSRLTTFSSCRGSNR